MSAARGDGGGRGAASAGGGATKLASGADASGPAGDDAEFLERLRAFGTELATERQSELQRALWRQGGRRKTFERAEVARVAAAEKVQEAQRRVQEADDRLLASWLALEVTAAYSAALQAASQPATSRWDQPPPRVKAIAETMQ
ncbi:unnamed protein product, partial [Prorocentrum cordatum]